ncbi:MAG TPA: dihydrofolate reductase family protein [Solirubrobacteraceae bacterium]|nr:dihydrofolate reductase family protein [Solirubrobacteraceae bacterium]
MRKLATGLFMSLDGVVESPSSWSGPYFDEELFEWINAGLPQADAILLGRRTYLEFAELWPAQENATPMAAFLNETPKYVVSSELVPLEWGPASLVRGDLTAEVDRLKRRAGRNIQVPGSPRLVSSLLREGLLDEFSLAVAPVVVGHGLRLFDEIGGPVPLKLADSRTMASGVLALTYQPALAGGEFEVAH